MSAVSSLSPSQSNDGLQPDSTVTGKCIDLQIVYIYYTKFIYIYNYINYVDYILFASS